MKKSTRIMALVLAGLMILGLLVSGIAQLVVMPAYAKTLQQEMNEVKNELAALEKEKDQIKKEIAGLDQSIQSANQKKSNIDRQISVTAKEIEYTESLIDKLSQDIDVKTGELDLATEVLNEQYDLYKKRIRVMYENGETTYLDVLLSSENFLDMLSRLEIVSQIMDYDKDLVKEFGEKKEVVATQKAALETSKNDSESLKSSLEGKKKSLSSQFNQSQAIISDLTADKQKTKEEWLKADQLEQKIQAEVQELARKIAAQSKGEYAGGTFAWPAPGYSKVTSSFGWRMHPILGYNKLHTGTDIGAPSGAKIVAANSGKVVKSTFNTSYGNYVMLDHGGGMVTLYAHMSSRSVQTGATVAKGQQIGKVGSTGWSTGAHLHFEVIKNGQYVNAMDYFSKK